jgi:hypothetical protein
MNMFKTNREKKMDTIIAYVDYPTRVENGYLYVFYSKIWYLQNPDLADEIDVDKPFRKNSNKIRFVHNFNKTS